MEMSERPGGQIAADPLNYQTDRDQPDGHDERGGTPPSQRDERENRAEGEGTDLQSRQSTAGCAEDDEAGQQVSWRRSGGGVGDDGDGDDRPPQRKARQNAPTSPAVDGCHRHHGDEKKGLDRARPRHDVGHRQ